MGMFDTVVAHCPRCDAEIHFQSKAGDCALARYCPGSVPSEIAMDLDGRAGECPVCGLSVALVTGRMPGRVPMHLTDAPVPGDTLEDCS